jgi:hypothetical protein
MTEPPVIDDQVLRGTQFEGCWRKLQRAAEHAKTIKQKLDGVHGQGLSTSGKLQGDPPYYVIWFDQVPSVDLYVGVVLGEFIHNVRSALDNLVWQLVKLGTDTNPARPKRIEFPLYDTEAEFWADRDRRMPGVWHPDRTILERHQPYHGGNTTMGHPLRLLDHLWNQDKHRVVLPIVMRTAEHETQTAEAIGGSLLRVEYMVDTNSALEVGAELCRAYTDPPGCKVRMHGHIAFEVTLEDGQALGAAMTEIMKEAIEPLKELTKKYH